MTHRPRYRHRGVALVIVMWVVIVAGLMIVGVMKAARQERALAHSELGAVQAHWLARAGVEQAMAVLDDDDPSVDSALEDWYRSPDLFEKVDLTTGHFSVKSAADNNRPGLDDESARLNLNSADKKQLDALQTLTETQIASLIDWRSGNLSEDQNPGGAKPGYYQHLKPPYDLRGKGLQTHRELLLVRGFEDRSFFGKPSSSLACLGPASLTTVYSYDANRDPKGNPRVNFNTVTAQTLQERFNFTPQLAQGVVQARNPQFQSFSVLTDVKPQQGAAAASNGSPRSNEPPVTQITLQWLASHIDQISLSDDARLAPKVNINTASREVLLTLPGMTDQLAGQIVSQRTASNGAFKSLSELLDRNIVEANIFKQMFEQLTVRSNVFTVESVGISSSGVQRRILATIDRGNKPMSIAYWYQTP